MFGKKTKEAMSKLENVLGEIGVKAEDRHEVGQAIFEVVYAAMTEHEDEYEHKRAGCGCC